MRRPVVSIMLDSAELSWLEGWIDAGALPTLARLREASARCVVRGIHPFTGELPHVAFLTSMQPAKLGYWGAYDYDAAACAPRYLPGPDYGGGVRCFYDHSAALNVCQFDLPKAGFARAARGVQVLNWGAQGSLNRSSSNPPSLFGEIERDFGLHPAMDELYLEPWQTKGLERLFNDLIEGVRLRTRVHRALLASSDWDLVLFAYSELHSGAHCFMHMDDPSFPLAASGERSNRLLEIARAIDASIADLLGACPADAAINVFSPHGMVQNGWDIASMYFLPEALHRLAFPERIQPAAGPLAPPSLGKWWWSETMWKRVFGAARPKPDLGAGINWIPSVWYAPDWPAMRAFAIPGLDEGMVRVNLAGRDAGGRVAARDYAATLDEVSALLGGLVNARNGRPLVERFFRTRADPFDEGRHLPPADLIVEWTQEPCDVAESPVVGRMGPVPLKRTGGHSHDGFAWFRDARLDPGERPAASVYDLGPTLLDLAGAEPPPGLDGVSLLRDWRERPDRPLFAEYAPAAPVA